MTPNDQISTSTKPVARYLLLLSLCSGSFIIAIWFLQVSPAIWAPSAFVLPPLLVVCLCLAIRLALSGTVTAPAGLLIPGVVFFVGGAVFDIAATLYHSPDLGQEANPIARSLLDSSYPLAMVYGLGGICQVLYVSLVCVLWAALLRHRSFLLASLHEIRSPMAFLKAATGGRGLTYRQWLFPMRLSEFADADYAVWVLAVGLFGGGVDRRYLGFEWFGLVSGLRPVVMSASVVVAICVYLAWLWSESRTPTRRR